MILLLLKVPASTEHVMFAGGFPDIRDEVCPWNSRVLGRVHGAVPLTNPRLETSIRNIYLKSHSNRLCRALVRDITMFYEV